jgi:HEAT repeat protein
VGPLADLLDGPRTVAACEAARCLGEIASPDARRALHRALREGSGPVRRAAAEAIGGMADFRDVEPLIAALREVPSAAASSLARIEHASVDEELAAALDELRGAARIEALGVLAARGHREAVAELLGILGTEGDGGRALLRLRAATGVDFGRDRGAWAAWWRRQERIAELSARSPELVAELLGRLKGTEGAAREALVADLLSLIEDPAVPEIARTRAILVLGHLEETRAVEPLLRILVGPRGLVRSYAAEALGRIGDPRALVPLCRQVVDVRDPDRETARRHAEGNYHIVDVECCKSLVRLGSRGGLRVAIDLLFKEWRIRMYHESVLLLRQATDRKVGFRPDAARADRIAAARAWLRWFRAHRTQIDLPGADELATHPAVRRDVEELVARLGMFKFLTSDTAKRTLMVVGEPAVPRLERALESDPNVHVRAHAAQILGEVGLPSSARALARALLKDPDAIVRTEAAQALALLGPAAAEESVPAFRDALLREGESPDVLAAVAEAMGLVSDVHADGALLATMAVGENASACVPSGLGAGRGSHRSARRTGASAGVPPLHGAGGAADGRRGAPRGDGNPGRLRSRGPRGGAPRGRPAVAAADRAEPGSHPPARESGLRRGDVRYPLVTIGGP